MSKIGLFPLVAEYPESRQMIPRTGSRGFTMIELIIVILILGVLGAMGSEFIAKAFTGFRDTDNRIEMYEEGRLALMRLERELHSALPNAVTVGDDGTAISFGVIDGAAMSRAGVFGRHTEESLDGQNTIADVSGGTLPAGDNPLVSVYNTDWGVFADGSRIYRIQSASAGVITLDRNIGTTSPYRRYYAVREQAVRFVVDENAIYRETATVHPDGNLETFNGRMPLVANVERSDPDGYFFYVPGTSTRNALVLVHFAIERDGERINFHKEIKVRNVP